MYTHTYIPTYTYTRTYILSLALSTKRVWKQPHPGIMGILLIGGQKIDTFTEEKTHLVLAWSFEQLFFKECL